MKFKPQSEQPLCACPECYQAGVSTRPQLVDRYGELLHGYALKRVWEARDDFWRMVDTKFAERKRGQS